jgi:hypothetical protein
MNDRDRDRTDSTEDRGGYPTMPPLDAVDPDLEQEGEAPDKPESGWGGAARAAEGELTEKERDRDR